MLASARTFSFRRHFARVGAVVFYFDTVERASSITYASLEKSCAAGSGLVGGGLACREWQGQSGTTVEPNNIELNPLLPFTP